MHSITYFVSCLAATALAAPTPSFFDDLNDYSNDMAEFLGKVGKRIDNAAENLFKSVTTCDTSKIELPSYASGLNGPSGEKPIYVAVGRGTQNYTCSSSSSNSTPTAVGALARLYNATCIAASYPDMIDLLPNIAYKIQLPTNDYDPLPPANIDLLGHHFFQGKTPVFNLDTTPSRQYGIAMTKKVDELAAPSNAVKGDNGAVAWLYLSTIDGTVGQYKSVYRVSTAGGAAPKTCKGMPSSFTVQYAANYYFFGE